MTDTLTRAGGRRIAVVLFNLGGPDNQETVKPFLFNLFNDPAIIGLPGFLRTPVARLISSRRETSAQANYAMMGDVGGGGSPLLPETRKQSEALTRVLLDRMPGDQVQAFIAMRYWHPLTDQTATDVAAFAPDEIVLLPLYPQFSTTTTQSSVKLWHETYTGPGRSRTVCCYPQATGWVEAQAQAICGKLDEAGDVPIRVLFSAHGIPEKLVKDGDPYQEQVEATVSAVVDRVTELRGAFDCQLCYQSRVGPLKWLGPSTPQGIEKAADDGVGLIVVPVAFVSEHIETLVELDIEYGELAHEKGVTPYLRTPTVSVAAPFIDTLADAVTDALGREGTKPFGPGCQGQWKQCPRQAEDRALGKAA